MSDIKNMVCGEESNMSKKCVKPHIRFAGFDEEWERRKLMNEVFSIDTGKSKFTLKTTGNYEILGSTSLIGYDDSYDYEGDFLLTARVGANAGELYRHSGKVKISDNTVFIQGQQLDFIYYALLNFDIKKLSFGTGQPLIKASELKNQNLLIPISNSEKEQISVYFCNLDRLITLHQNKYDKLTNIKKAMLEKMFPKNGANVPEIRFKGFSGNWERRKLEEVVDIYDGVHQTPEYKDSGIMFLSVENITTLKSNKYISEESFKKDYKVYPQKGDILMTRIGDVGTPNVVETMEKLAFYVSLALLKPTNIECYFLCNAIQSSLFQKRLRDRTLITAIPQKINKEEIGKIDIILSTFVQEQRQIGAFFKQLDKLITLHQKRVEKLQSIKKACIEKMFV